jgi:hypothetical protein
MAEYYSEQLPEFDVGVGNFATRNARYRAFVCNHFDLKFVSVGGNGNCFFESLSLLLRPKVNASELRQNVVDLFRSCIDSTQPLFERIIMDIEQELNQELTCSRRGSNITGFKPSTVEEYIDAVAHDGVWVQGLHWSRAVSFLYDVRVAVVLYGQDIVRFIGRGDSTVFLYKTDDTTHFDPLVPLVHSSVSSEEDVNAPLSPTAVPPAIIPAPSAIPQCTLPQSETAASETLLHAAPRNSNPNHGLVFFCVVSSFSQILACQVSYFHRVYTVKQSRAPRYNFKNPP